MKKYKVLRACIRVAEGNKPYDKGGFLSLKDSEVEKRAKGGYIDPTPIGTVAKPKPKKTKTKT